jgi:predicted metal-dependent peptidase
VKKRKPCPAERIGAISDKWFIREPAFLLALTSHEARPNPRIHTIRSGMGVIEYNPGYIDSLPDEALEQALTSECVRILLRHPYRFPPNNAAISYRASNITINEWYEGLDLPYRAGDFWSDQNHKRQNFEFYYRELIQLAESSGGPGSDDESGGANSNGSGLNASAGDSGEQESQSWKNDGAAGQNENPGRDAGDYDAENAGLWDEDNFYNGKIDAIIEHLQQNADKWGSVKGDFAARLVASLKPELDYRKVLSGFRKTILSSRYVLTRFRPSRRYGFMYMGMRRKFTTKLLVAVDVSGSITDKQLSAFYSAINRFFKYGVEFIDVQQFDAVLQGKPVPMAKARRDIDIIGRGGTSFEPVIEYFATNVSQYDGLIIFTDGCAEIPDVPPSVARLILWICATKRDYERSRSWMRERGRCCWIKE